MGASLEKNNQVERRLKLRELRILLEVSKAGTMGRAAATLSVSQPVVSKAVSELEAVLGVRLFDRTALGITPTAHGRAMINCSRAVFDELKLGVQAIEFLDDPTSGQLHIGCTEFGASGLASSVIEGLARRHPRLQFHVTMADPISLATVELPRRNIELSMGGLPPELPAEVQAERLFDDVHVVMAGVDSPWARRRKLQLAELLEARWVLPPVGSLARRLVDDAFRGQGLAPPDARVSTFSTPLCHQLLASGNYLAVLPRGATRMAKHLPIRPLNVDFPGITRTVGIMTLKQRTLSPVAQLFIDAARKAAAPFAKT
jgi:DNA-binding transcriptional LysR family regulator